MTFESKRGQNEEKWKLLQFEKSIIFTTFFWLVPWFLISKMICKTLGGVCIAH